MNRNFIITVSIVLFSVATVISGLAWLNNIVIAKEWYGDVNAGNVYKIVSTQEELEQAKKQNIEAKIYVGFMPCLAWCSKLDISTVTTLVPFLGFLLITIGLVRIMIWRRVLPKRISEDYPFFHDYDRKMVILGLAGTFWGIIMIGYYPPEKIDMSNLMLCLHTALYSTLIAVLWVFFIAIPGRQVMAWLAERCTGLKVGLDQDITAVFEDFGAASVEAGNHLKESSKNIKAFKKELKDASKFLEQFREKTGVEVLDALKDSYEKVGTALEQISQNLEDQKDFQNQLLEQQQKIFQESQTVVNEYKAELLAQAKQRDEAQARERALVQEKSALVSKLDQIKAGIKDMADNL